MRKFRENTKKYRDFPSVDHVYLDFKHKFDGLLLVLNNAGEYLKGNLNRKFESHVFNLVIRVVPRKLNPFNIQ